MLAAIGGMGGSPQPLMLVPDGNVIIGMQSYEDPGNNISGGVAGRYAPIQTCMITGCNITNIALSNTSAVMIMVQMIIRMMTSLLLILSFPSLMHQQAVL
jgi:hypothetical protein